MPERECPFTNLSCPEKCKANPQLSQLNKLANELMRQRIRVANFRSYTKTETADAQDQLKLLQMRRRASRERVRAVEVIEEQYTEFRENLKNLCENEKNTPMY